MKKLIEKYSHQDTLLMISLYPKKGEVYSAGASGIASYAKNLATHMTRKVVILADYEKNPEMYEEGQVLVYRCFSRNNSIMWISLLKALLKFSGVKNILVQFDFAMYGGVVTSSFIIPFLAIIKLFGFQINVVMHSVVVDIFKLKGHVGLGEGIFDKFKGYIYNVIFHLFYSLLNIVSSQIIVLEEVLKERLGSVIPLPKITAIPHGVDTDLNAISKSDAREKLGIGDSEYVILFFGFVNWFKGADFFVDSYTGTKKFLGKKARFIIAGGKSPTMQDRPFYQKYFSAVLEKIYSAKNIAITGYVPQEKIGLYFSACDIVVLPYRYFMTASGVLSLVFSYKKPFLVSSELSPIFDESDFKKAFETVGLRKDEVIFHLSRTSCLRVTERVLKDGLKSKMRNVAQIIRGERSYKNTALLYEKLIYEPVLSIKNRPALSFDRQYDQ